MPAPRSSTLSWRQRALRLLPKLLLVGLIANALRLRRRLSRIGTLPEVDADVAVADGAVLDGWVFVTAAGVELDDATKVAAARYAERSELEVVDLVPADLPVDRALETIRMVATSTYRANRLHPGRGAFQALAVSADVADRAGIESTTGLDPFEMVQVTTKLKRYAPSTTDLAVAPTLVASADDLEKRQSFLRAIYGGAAFAPPIVQGVQLAALAASVRKRPAWGAAVAAAYSAQPLAVFGGAPAGLAPRDLNRHAARRLLDDISSTYRTWTSGWRSPVEVDEHEIRRPVYAELLAGGVDHFLEPRRDNCPWCGSSDLFVRLTAPDRLQHKPGVFTLEQCRDCDVVFQNPRLTVEGLDFYYRDFYDGLGEEQLEFIFGASDRPYTGRADMLKPFADPKRWLDVGTGHGHFCLVAKEAWPDTVFDGLDLSESIEEAERRGWIDHGYRGLFPEVAPELANTYDVVSMHHYLEHVREPHDELDAAATALVPGGHLLIEVPDPECLWGRVLDSYWLPWFQPQHQTLIPIANLKQALEERGFEILAEDRGEADQPVELLAATWFAIDGFAPNPRLPWGPPVTLGRRAKRAAALTAGVPVLLLALLADVIHGQIIRPTNGGNGYRVLARKIDDAAADARLG